MEWERGTELDHVRRDACESPDVGLSQDVRSSVAADMSKLGVQEVDLSGNWEVSKRAVDLQFFFW